MSEHVDRRQEVGRLGRPRPGVVLCLSEQLHQSVDVDRDSLVKVLLSDAVQVFAHGPLQFLLVLLVVVGQVLSLVLIRLTLLLNLVSGYEVDVVRSQDLDNVLGLLLEQVVQLVLSVLEL